MRLAWLLTSLCLAASACAEEPGPEEVVAEVTRLAGASRSSNSYAYGDAIFSRLASSSVAYLQECAVAINGKLGRELLRPQECVGMERFWGLRGEPQISVISADATKASVRVFSGDVARTVELVYEDGWKVDLLSSLATNGAL